MSSIATHTARYLYALQTGSLVAPNLGISADKAKAINKTLDSYDRSLSGQIEFNDDRIPTADTKLNFYVKDFFCFKHFVGSATTDANGNFSFHYNWEPNRFSRSQQVVIDLVQKRAPFAKLPGIKNEVTLQQIERTFPIDVKTNNIGKILVNCEDISNDDTVVAFPQPSQLQAPRYFWKLITAALPEIPKRIFVSVFAPWLSTESVQKIYDLFGPSYPKISITDDNFIDILLNKLCGLSPTSTNSGKVVWDLNWDEYEFLNETSLPNVKVVAAKDKNGVLKMESIAIKFRSDPITFHFKPDSIKRDWAYYVSASAFMIYAEAIEHLAKGHIIPGIVGAEFLKYIPADHPLYAPIAPHLEQIEFINWVGSKGVIFGKGSVLSKSALSVQAVADLISNGIRENADWAKYQPPKPVANDHYHAKAEALHFSLLHGFFSDYIQKNREAIVAKWSSIYQWSEALHKKIETLPLITTHKKKPSDSDLKNLAKFCSWIVSKTTFLHWAAHSRQAYGTDIHQLSLAMRDKALNAQGELQPTGNTSPEDANMQLFLGRLLLNFKGDSLFANPNGDVNKDLINLIRSHIGEYEGYQDILKMHLTTQI